MLVITAAQSYYVFIPFLFTELEHTHPPKPVHFLQQVNCVAHPRTKAARGLSVGKVLRLGPHHAALAPGLGEEELLPRGHLQALPGDAPSPMTQVSGKSHSTVRWPGPWASLAPPLPAAASPQASPRPATRPQASAQTPETPIRSPAPGLPPPSPACPPPSPACPHLPLPAPTLPCLPLPSPACPHLHRCSSSAMFFQYLRERRGREEVNWYPNMGPSFTIICPRSKAHWEVTGHHLGSQSLPGGALGTWWQQRQSLLGQGPPGRFRGAPGLDMGLQEPSVSTRIPVHPVVVFTEQNRRLSE